MTAQPIGPRLTTNVAFVTRRAAFSAAMMSVLPPAIANSSSVPITRSNGRQDRLQMRGDRVARDEARLAVAALGEAPQHRPIVDVEDRAHVVRPRPFERQAADAMHVRGREMRAGDEQRLRLREKIGGDVSFGHRHVGAVLAIEDQRERVAVLDSQHDRRGEPRRIDADVRDVAAFTRDRLDEKAAHRVVADACRHRRLEPETRAAERGVGRRAAQVFGEARDILETGADLLRVEIDGEPSETDDVVAAPGREGGVVLHDGMEPAASTIRAGSEFR